MELRPEHLGYLVCPACKCTLAFSRGAVECVVCRRRYPVEDGIPVLIEGRATRA